MKADLVAKIKDDLSRHHKDQDLGQTEDHVVTELTPQAKLLAEMAKQAATKTVEGDWDVKPHPLLLAAAPTREQFDAEATAPVVLMRNPIAGKQVSTSAWWREGSFMIIFCSTMAMHIRQPASAACKFCAHSPHLLPYRGVSSSRETMHAANACF